MRIMLLLLSLALVVGFFFRPVESVSCVGQPYPSDTLSDSFSEELQPWIAEEWVDSPLYVNTQPLYPPNQYAFFRHTLRDSLSILREKYRQASSFERDSLLEKAGALLVHTLTDHYFPCWYGTKWDFNGYTAKPQEGEIACGYFVSTPLLHAGFRLNRYRLAQQGAREIIQSLSDDIVEWGDVGAEVVANRLRSKPDGLYVVGLYNHVGWLHVQSGKVYFIHSTFMGPGSVIREEAAKSEVLEGSNVYVVGAISGNERLMDQWLRNDTLAVVMTY